MKHNNSTLTLWRRMPAKRQFVRPNLLHKLFTLLVLFAGVGTSQQVLAQTFYNDAITLTQKPTSATASTSPSYAGKRASAPYNTYTRLGNSNASPVVASPQVGTYDLNNNSTLVLSAGKIEVSPPATQFGIDYAGARLQYRVYLTSTTPVPNYSQISLANTSQTTGSYTYESTGANINLLNGLSSGGDYTLEVQFVIDTKDSDGNITPTIDPSGANGYTVSFYVTPPPTTPPGGTTTWQSTTSTGGSTDWTLRANWSNGVPTRFSNAIIPAKDVATIVYPILNNPTTTYEVNNLTLQGNQNSSRAELTITTATLRVYGNISQVAGGLSGNTSGTIGVTDPINNSTLVLAGGNQIITGNLVVADIIIAGSGTKSVINQLTPSNVLAFQPSSVANGVIIQSAAQDITNNTVNTVFDTTGNSYIQLIGSSTISIVPGQAETTTSYIKGVTRADRQLSAGTTNTFGNIGLDLSANHSPGTIVLYRVVGDALTGPVSSTAVPIKRQYRVQGDVNSNNAAFAGSTIDVVFHYLDSGANTSANELNGISESNLSLYRTVTNGAPYQALFGDLDQAANTVTRTTVNSLPNFTLTLGDRTNPLPVSLIAFSAARVGNNAALTWTTASELNNTGFEVQVSTDAVNYRKLAFVGSKMPTSVQTQSYTYTDVEPGKSGTRYYRLRQVDADGQFAYTFVRAVNFPATDAVAAAISIYPNPSTNNDQPTIAVQSPIAGAGSLQVVDLTGRTLINQSIVTIAGVTELAVTNSSALNSGIYLVKVTLPSGETKTIRMQKR